MKMQAGTFKSTAADIYLCLGFVPDFLKLTNLTDATNKYTTIWNRHQRSLAFIEGNEITGLDTSPTEDERGVGEGVQPYLGGDLITALSTVYLVRDPDPDKRDAGAGAVISQWSNDTPASRTGSWNDVCDTSGVSPVGVGSKIRIDGKEYTIVAQTDKGEAADEVTLDRVVATGPGTFRIDFLGGRFDMIGIGAGLTTPAGVKLDVTLDTIATGSEIIMFEAGTYA